MSKVCVEIEMDTETGDLTVAECAPKEEAMAGEESGEPAGQSFSDIESALKAAAELLTAGRQPDGMGAMKEAMQGGYDKVARKPPQAGMGGGNQFIE